MERELPLTPASTTLDPSGLPVPVVQNIKRLVDSLREEIPREEQSRATPRGRPLRGRFADQNLSIPKEDIDAAQREAWVAFPRDFPESGQS